MADMTAFVEEAGIDFVEAGSHNRSVRLKVAGLLRLTRA
jgi:hypothetical protein